MRKLILIFLFLTVGTLAMSAQGDTPGSTVSIYAAGLNDATGTPLASGTICFAPVDNNGHPLSFKLGGSGQVVTRPVCTTVTNGAFSYTLADTEYTNPQHVCIAATVTDNVTGASLLGAGYSCLQPSSNFAPGGAGYGWCYHDGTGNHCNFDLYIPNIAALPVTTIQGGGGGSGSSNAGASLVLTDSSASGTYWALTTANGSLQIASTTSSSGAVSSFTFTDSVSGTHVMTVSNGSLQIN